MTCLKGSFNLELEFKRCNEGVLAENHNCKAEYIATCDAVKEGLWLKGLLQEIIFINDVLMVYIDNQSTIHLSKNPV